MNLLKPVIPLDCPLNSDFLRLARDVWTEDQMQTLYYGLHNNNGAKSCGMAWRDKQGEYQFKRTKSKSARHLISWSVDSAFGKARSDIAYAPYSKNPDNMSRWGALDFDAHDLNFVRARTLLRRAFLFLRDQPGLFLIVEHSGKGFHLWALTRELQKVSWWVRLLKKAATEAGATVRGGLCELFPDGARHNQYGKAMRAPGSYHPSLDCYSKIEFENCEDLLEFWSKEQRAGKHLLGGEREEFLSYCRESEPELIKVYPLNDQWLHRFKIGKASTRNDMLKDFTSFMFTQVSTSRAEHYVRRQFEMKTVNTRATLGEHLEAFAKIWTGMMTTWLNSLSPGERQVYESLPTESSKEAFRILRGWSKLTAQNGAPEFKIALASLGERLEITRPGASYIVRQFTKAGIIVRTKKCIPMKCPAFYVWKL